MRFYDSFGMNPRTIRFYLIEKGIDLPRHEVNILAADNRKSDYLKLNPAGPYHPSINLTGTKLV